MHDARPASDAAIETRIAAALPMPAWLTGLVLAIALTTLGLACMRWTVSNSSSPQKMQARAWLHKPM